MVGQLRIHRNASDGDIVDFPLEGHRTLHFSRGDLRFVLKTSHLHQNFRVIILIIIIIIIIIYHIVLL
jgi:hypothetical protein